MCTGTGGYWMGCQWFVTLSFCLLRCILWRLSGCSSRSSLTTTLPRQPSEQSHSKFLVERRLSFQSPSHRTQEPLPTRILEHVASSSSLNCLKEVIRILVHGDHHDTGLWHLLLYLPCGFQAIHHRHPDVHEDQVGCQFSTDIQGLPTVVGLSDDFDAFFPGEHDSKTFSDQGVVVCYKQACHL